MKNKSRLKAPNLLITFRPPSNNPSIHFHQENQVAQNSTKTSTTLKTTTTQTAVQRTDANRRSLSISSLAARKDRVPNKKLVIPRTRREPSNGSLTFILESQADAWLPLTTQAQKQPRVGWRSSSKYGIRAPWLIRFVATLPRLTKR